MTAATLLAEIEQADGEIWTEGDRLKFRAVPARLIPAIRENKAELLALLATPAPDDYAIEERRAIQWEPGQPPLDDPTGTAGVPGFEGMPDLTPAEHGAILQRLTNPAQGAPAPAPQSPLRHSGPMIPVLEKDRHGETVVRGFRRADPPIPRLDANKAPARVTCGQCGEFEPGLEPESLGRCSRTADGLPPVASRGYGVCFPHAPRTCPDYKEP